MLLKLATFMPHFGLNFIGTKVRLTLDRVRFVRNNSRTNGNEVNERDISEYFFLFTFQLVGQYPPPPPVATGPGLDRPLFIPTPDYGGEGYTMNRTRMFYQDQFDPSEADGPTAFIYPESGTQPSGSNRSERRISGGERPNTAFGAGLESPRRLDNETRWWVFCERLSIR